MKSSVRAFIWGFGGVLLAALLSLGAFAIAGSGISGSEDRPLVPRIEPTSTPSGGSDPSPSDDDRPSRSPSPTVSASPSDGPDDHGGGSDDDHADDDSSGPGSGDDDSDHDDD